MIRKPPWPARNKRSPSGRKTPPCNTPMGLSLDAAGRPGEAAAYYGRARQLDPGNEVYAASYDVAQTARRKFCPRFRRSCFFGATLDAEQTAYSGPPAVDDRGENRGLQACLKAGEQALAQAAPDAAFAAFQQAQSLRPEDPQVSIAAAVASLRQNHPGIGGPSVITRCAEIPRMRPPASHAGAAYYRHGGLPFCPTGSPPGAFVGQVQRAGLLFNG